MQRDNLIGREESIEDSYHNEAAGAGGSKHESLNTCSIIVGIMSYLLLFFKGTFWLVMFGIFSFKTNLPQCIAVNGIE